MAHRHGKVLKGRLEVVCGLDKALFSPLAADIAPAGVDVGDTVLIKSLRVQFEQPYPGLTVNRRPFHLFYRYFPEHFLP